MELTVCHSISDLYVAISIYAGKHVQLATTGENIASKKHVQFKERQSKIMN